MTEGWVIAAFVFCRMSGLLLTLPVLSMVGVPKHVQVLLAALMTILIFPSMPAPESMAMSSVILGVAGELFLGISLGMIVKAAYSAFAVGAELISRQTALGMSSLFDPLINVGQSAIGILASLLAGIIFISTDQHLHVIEAVARSFHAMPPGHLANVTLLSKYISEAVSTAIVVGIQLAGPLIALVFLVNVFIGVLGKLAPRMNMFFSVGMTVNSIIGVWLFGIALPWIMQTHLGTVEATVKATIELLLVGGLR